MWLRRAKLSITSRVTGQRPLGSRSVQDMNQTFGRGWVFISRTGQSQVVHMP